MSRAAGTSRGRSPATAPAGWGVRLPGMLGPLSQAGWRPEGLGAGGGGRWGDWVEKPETWEEGKQVSFFRAPVLPAHVVGEKNMPVTFVCLETKRERELLFFFFFWLENICEMHT